MNGAAQMIRVFCLLLGGLLATAVQAGQTCTSTPTTATQMQQGLALASQLQQRLNASGAQVALVARVGEDVSRYGLRYTHAGLAYRDSPTDPWAVLHKLNTCGTGRSALYRQGLGNFFLDTPFEYRSLMVALKPDVAERLLRAIKDQQQGLVDEPRYSLLAYPFATQFQNSNGWLLEFLAYATAAAPPGNRAAVQRRLRTSAYFPDTVHVGALERVGAGLTRANVSFLDHPLGERLSGEYSTVTVESIVRWLDRQNWIAQREEIAP